MTTEIGPSIWTTFMMRSLAPGKWLDCKKDLPIPGIYVLARCTRGTWFDSTDSEGVGYVWVKRVIPVEGGEVYRWFQFGPDRFSMHEISHWTYVPRMRP